MPWKNGNPPLYTVWRSMLDRCYNTKYSQYKDYGGRGIRVCPQWRHSYTQFYLDMSPRPPGLTIDRIDNDKDYSKANCKWSTRKEQSRNRRNTRKVTIEGKIWLVSDLVDRSGVKGDIIVYRSKQGLTLKEVTSKKRRFNLVGFKLGGPANGLRQKSRTHCKRGHEFTTENTRVTPEGWRQCRACHAAKVRRQSAAKKLLA
jgi:hypothetical protein